MKAFYFILGCCLMNSVQSLLNITVAAQLGGHVTLPCRLPMPIQSGVIVRWFSAKDSWLTSGTRVYKHRDRMSVTKPAPNEWNLRINKLDLAFADIYTCHTDTNTTVSIIDLVIESAPKIDEGLSTNSRYSVKEASNANMKCVVTGTPQPKIEWFRGIEERPIGVYGAKLVIRNVQRYASDLYICRAENKNGKAEKRINMTVQFEPEVSVRLTEVFASQGEAVVLSCVVQGYPLYDTYWTDKRNRRISTNWKYLVMEDIAGNGIPVKFISLIFRPAIITIHDYGNYMCNAKGETAHVTKGVSLNERVETKNDEKIIHY